MQRYRLISVKEKQNVGKVIQDSLNKDDMPLIISVDCDSLSDKYEEIYNYHQKNEHIITVVTCVKRVQIPYDIIETDLTGNISNMSEKPEFTFMVETGMYVISPEIVKYVPRYNEVGINQLIRICLNNKGSVGVFNLPLKYSK